MKTRFPWAHRAVAMLLPVVTASVLVACSTTPAPSPAPAVKTDRTSALRAIGFERTDEGFVLNLSDSLMFDSASDVLSASARSALAKLAGDLKALEISRLRLYGHTDNTGSADFNRELSTRRAEAVAREMASHGFGNDQLERRGFASERPIATNATPEGRAQNRRVAVIVPFE